MAENLVLDATTREGTGKGAARTARREGLVPGVIYGGNAEPTPINVKFSVLLKHLKAGQFMSQLLNVKVDGTDNRVICRAVQRDVVKDLPLHVDFLRLSEKSRVNLQIPVEFINHEVCPGLKRGGTMTIVRPLVELRVTAGNIPDHLTVDLSGLDVGDVVTISKIELPEGSRPVISDRDFVVANITAPSSLKSSDADDESEETEEVEAEDSEES